jgi:hypothetical protein
LLDPDTTDTNQQLYLDPWRDDPDASSNEDPYEEDDGGLDDEDDSGDDDDEEVWEDADADADQQCICGHCTEDPDIPAKCCLSQPCVGLSDSGKNLLILFDFLTDLFNYFPHSFM